MAILAGSQPPEIHRRGRPQRPHRPYGYGSQAPSASTGYYPYTIEFENDGATAAQVVTVTEQLANNLDWSTFQLGSFGFGSVQFNVPAGLTDYSTIVAYQNLDPRAYDAAGPTPLLVQFVADFNVQTGFLTISFISLDPATGQPPSGVFDGFLPALGHVTFLADDEGFAQYVVQPKPKVRLTSDNLVQQQAAVVFDINAPIPTNFATNTIDTAAPTSSAARLADDEQPQFQSPGPARMWPAARQPRGSPTSTFFCPTTAGCSALAGPDHDEVGAQARSAIPTPSIAWRPITPATSSPPTGQLRRQPSPTRLRSPPGSHQY